MIIDVVELNFNILNFTRSYEKGRYERGKKLYKEGLVEVQEVDKNNDNYSIKAYVRGNYGVYTTKLSLVKSTIKDYSCTCEDYRKGYLCKHIIATSMEIIEPHYASTEKGKKEIEKAKKKEELIQLRELRKRQFEKDKKRQYDQKYSDSLHKLADFERGSFRGTVSHGINLSELYRETIEERKTKNNALATNIKLEYSAEINDNKKLRLSFKIGQTRMYALKSISDFYKAYKDKKEIYYGKQLSFIPERENFEEESRKIFDLIIKFAEMIEYSNSTRDRYYITPIYLGKYLDLTGKNIEEFFNIIKKKELKTLSPLGVIKYDFTDEKLDIFCTLKKEIVEVPKLGTRTYYYYKDDLEDSEEYVLRLNIDEYSILMSNDKIYVFYENNIYTLEKTEKLINTFKLFENDDKILIPEDKMIEFERYMFPKIKQVKIEDVPEEAVKEAILVGELNPKMLLDVDKKENILLELKFCYGKNEFNILENGYLTYVRQNNIQRNIPKETEIIKRIFFDGFEPVLGRKEFVMKNQDDIFDFLSYKIQKYLNEFEVFVTDAFKNREIRYPKISNIGIKIDNGLLEMDISKMNVDISEIKDILKDYKIKKKYHKLKNGDFLDLSNNESLNLLDELETTLDIDYSKAEKGIVNLPISRSFYLEKVVKNNENITVSKNEKFTEVVDEIGNTDISKDIKIDKNFEKKLRDYQKVGYRWLKTLEKYKLRWNFSRRYGTSEKHYK